MYTINWYVTTSTDSKIFIDIACYREYTETGPQLVFQVGLGKVR